MRLGVGSNQIPVSAQEAGRGAGSQLGAPVGDSAVHLSGNLTGETRFCGSPPHACSRLSCKARSHTLAYRSASDSPLQRRLTPGISGACRRPPRRQEAGGGTALGLILGPRRPASSSQAPHFPTVPPRPMNPQRIFSKLRSQQPQQIPLSFSLGEQWPLKMLTGRSPPQLSPIRTPESLGHPHQGLHTRA